MKILKYSLAILLFLFGVLIVIGAVKKEVNYSTEVVIDRPVSHVWYVFTNEELSKEWIVGLQKYEKVKGEINQAGSEFDVHFIDNGEEIILREKVLEVVPEEKYKFQFVNPVMNSTIEVNMEPISDDQTKVVANTTAIGGHIVWRGIFALMRSGFQKRDQEIYGGLKRVSEETPIQEIVELEPIPADSLEAINQ